MTQPYRPSQYHEVALRTGNAEAARAAPAAGFGDFGPWYVTGYVFCFGESDQLAQPGDNSFNINLSGLTTIGTPVAVSADVSELINSYYPHIGDAIFLTKGVMLNQPFLYATVLFTMDWGSPLPVCITMNIGFMANPYDQAARPSPRYAAAPVPENTRSWLTPMIHVGADRGLASSAGRQWTRV
jgi:hypothetical protein